MKWAWFCPAIRVAPARTSVIFYLHHSYRRLGAVFLCFCGFSYLWKICNEIQNRWLPVEPIFMLELIPTAFSAWGTLRWEPLQGREQKSSDGYNTTHLWWHFLIIWRLSTKSNFTCSQQEEQATSKEWLSHPKMEASWMTWVQEIADFWTGLKQGAQAMLEATLILLMHKFLKARAVAEITWLGCKHCKEKPGTSF